MKRTADINCTARARAPLRLGLGGGGTDVSPYCDRYGGSVLNATVTLFAYATLEPAPPGRVTLRSVDTGECVELAADPELPLDGRLPLHRGVYRRIVNQFNGGKPLSIRLTTSCDVPAGSGLGSSSTLVVAMVEAFKEALMLPLGEYEVAHLAYTIEREDLAIRGGRQDQYAATFGGINFIEFAGDRVIVNPLRIRNSVLAELEASLLLYFTGASRESSAIIEEQSHFVRDNRQQSIDALHALKADAVEMKERLLRGDITGLATVLHRSWKVKKSVSGRISNASIDGIHAAAMEAGALAGKVSGAGGGGFMMFLSEPTRRFEVMAQLSAQAGHWVPCHLTKGGAMSWRV